MKENAVESSEPLQWPPGITRYEYQMPVLDTNGEPRDPVQYKRQVFEKTVYDPKVYSDEKMHELAVDAAKEGYAEGYGRWLDDPDDNQYTASSGGINFRVYLDRDTGDITNIHPKIQGRSMGELFENGWSRTDSHWIIKVYFNRMYEDGLFMRALELIVARSGLGGDGRGCAFSDETDDFEGVYFYSGITDPDEIVVTPEICFEYVRKACALYLQRHPEDTNEVNGYLAQIPAEM